MPRYAAIDIGSNSIRMLAAETAPGTPAKILAAERQVTRLGAGFSAMAASLATRSSWFAIFLRGCPGLPELNVVAVRAVATSAVRDASNQQEFLERAGKL